MIKDPTNQFIAAIMSQADLDGKDVLEIGCGAGRITRDLAKHAKRVVATDPDEKAIAQAREKNAAPNVEYLVEKDGIPQAPAGSFDAVIYTLSLHHVPPAEMTESLRRSAALLGENGIVIVIEPGYSGSFIEAKNRFDAGSGDESEQQQAAIRAMNEFAGWTPGPTIVFRTLVTFDSEEDFLASMLPSKGQMPQGEREEVSGFLDRHRTPTGISLDAYRRLNVLRRNLA